MVCVCGVCVVYVWFVVCDVVFGVCMCVVFGVWCVCVVYVWFVMCDVVFGVCMCVVFGVWCVCGVCVWCTVRNAFDNIKMHGTTVKKCI